MSTEDTEFLEKSKYISLQTRKRSGEFVATPVWFAVDGDSYYLFTENNTGKFKRLRNFSEVRIAPCTYPGELTGPVVETTAYIIESEEESARAAKAVRDKYPWELPIINFLAWVTGKSKKRRFIRIDAVAVRNAGNA